MSLYEIQEKDIYELFDKHLMNEKNKDKYGEVFTPRPLIEEILNKIPKSCYSHPHWKWLDPAAGTGHFFLLLFLRLMKGLAKAIPQVQKRKAHILENMFVMVEYNKTNVQTLKKLFGPKCQIISGNFLTQKFAPHSFDGILGNPPFQVSKKESYKGSAGNRTLWDLFLKKILETPLLKPHGYLGFLTPSSWRRPESKIYSMILQDYSLRYLRIYGKEDGVKKLGAQTRFDVYVLHGSPSKKNSVLIDEKGKKHTLDIHKWPFLPNYNYHKFRKVLVSKKSEGIPILFDSSCYYAQKLSKNKSKKHKISVVHNITRKGLGLRYASKKCPHLHKPKVLLNFNEKQYPVNDYLGKYGMSQITFGIPITSKHEGEQWIKVIESPFFQELLEASKWNSFQTDYRMFSYFSKNKDRYKTGGLAVPLEPPAFPK